MSDDSKYLHMELYSMQDITDAKALSLRQRAYDEGLSPEDYAEVLRGLTLGSVGSKRVLSMLCQKEFSSFRPDKCDTIEPPQMTFVCGDLSTPMRWLSQCGGTVHLAKKGRYRYKAVIENRRLPALWQTRKGEGTKAMDQGVDPVMLTRSIFWIRALVQEKEEVDEISNFFLGSAKALEATFGFITTEEDFERRNLRTEVSEQGLSTRFVVHVAEKQIPGIYWLNFLGSHYSKLFQAKIAMLPKDVVHQVDFEDGLIIQCASTPSQMSEPVTLDRINSIMKILGEAAFSDVERLHKH